MFNRLKKRKKPTPHTHRRAVIDSFGQVVFRPATCAEVDETFGSHFIERDEIDGIGRLVTTCKIITCADADARFIQLEASNGQLQSQVYLRDQEIDTLNTKVAGLEAELAKCRELMDGAIQVIFGLGPALQRLFSDDLAAPTLTADRSAIVLEGILYSIILDVFKERIIVRAVNCEVPEKIFSISKGAVSEDGRTLMLGYVTRIKEASSGEDPVLNEISLIGAPMA